MFAGGLKTLSGKQRGKTRLKSSQTAAKMAQTAREAVQTGRKVAQTVQKFLHTVRNLCQTDGKTVSRAPERGFGLLFGLAPGKDNNPPETFGGTDLFLLGFTATIALGSACGGAFLRAVVGDALGERIAVNAEDGGCAREVLFVAGEGFLNLELFKLGQGFVEHDLAVEHIVYQSFKAGAHLH